MNKEEARKFLESQRNAKKEKMQKVEDALNEFDEWDEIGVNLLGPTTELSKRRIIKEIEENKDEEK